MDRQNLKKRRTEGQNPRKARTFRHRTPSTDNRQTGTEENMRNIKSTIPILKKKREQNSEFKIRTVSNHSRFRSEYTMYIF